jgi:hypothetical protein
MLGLRLENYIMSLLESKLSFEPWVAALVWVALFLANHWIARFTRAANDAQHFIAVEDWGALRRGAKPKYIVAQVLLGCIPSPRSTGHA